MPKGQREELLARFSQLPSGREKPGRYWKIDLDAIEPADLKVAQYTTPQIKSPDVRGLIACDLETARREHGVLLEHAYGKAVAMSERKFAALAGAYENSGAFIYIPEGAQTDETIEVTYHANGAALFPHTVILTEGASRCTVMERITGDDEAFICGITEIVTGESSTLTYVYEQSLPENARTFYTRGAVAGKDSSLNWCAAELGAQLSATTSDIRIEQPGADASLNAFFFPRGNQHVDFVSSVIHDVGESQSQTLVKSVATDAGQARYLGNIKIAPHAQASEAFLRDDALMLSKKAHIDSVPALEIAANDVKAYHGATIGSLDEAQIFYMNSRGIDRLSAERMIALGFFEPVLERFPTEELREHLRAALREKVAA